MSLPDRPHPALCPVCPGMYPLAFAAGVAIEYKARVKRWLQYIHDRPVDNSIHEAGCRDQALFRLKNIKLLVSAGLIAVVQQMIVGVVVVVKKNWPRSYALTRTIVRIHSVSDHHCRSAV